MSDFKITSELLTIAAKKIEDATDFTRLDIFISNLVKNGMNNIPYYITRSIELSKAYNEGFNIVLFKIIYTVFVELSDEKYIQVLEQNYWREHKIPEDIEEAAASAIFIVNLVGEQHKSNIPLDGRLIIIKSETRTVQ